MITRNGGEGAQRKPSAAAEAFDKMAAILVAGKIPNTEAARTANNEIALKAWPLVLSPISHDLADVIVRRTKPDAGIRMNDRFAKAGRPTESFGLNVQAVHALALAHAGDIDGALRENDALLAKITVNKEKSRLPNMLNEFLGREHSDAAMQWLAMLQRSFILKLSLRTDEFQTTLDRANELGLQLATSKADEVAGREISLAIASLSKATNAPSVSEP